MITSTKSTTTIKERLNKKGIAYMQQMMNKTVLIQNQDYQVLGKSIHDPLVNNKQSKNHAYLISNNNAVRTKSKDRAKYLDIKEFMKRHVGVKKTQPYYKENCNVSEDFEFPQKRHNSHEGRAKSDSVHKERVPTSALDKRNFTITSYEKEHSLTPDIIKRINTGGGKRQLQPRQNPSIGED